MHCVKFTIDDVAWMRACYPELPAETFDDMRSFKAEYTLKRDGKGSEYYELRTADGRTNYNDLDGYEKMTVWDCDRYFSNRLHTVFAPGTPTGIDYCMAVSEFDVDD